jgi:methylmalonyl-CoA mutase cobalamin-binding subunit
MAGVNDSPHLERLLTLAALAVAVVAAYVAKAILVPIALAVLLSFVLAPLVARLERLRLGRVPSVVMVVILAAIIVTAVGLWLIGLPNALLWGLLALVLRFLPYVGAWIAAAMPILLSVVIFDGWVQPLLVIGLFIVAEVTISNFVEPFIFGSSMGINPIGVLIAAIFWTWLWGPVGLVIAMPMTVCLVVAAHYIPQSRFLEILLGDRPTLSPEERTYQRLLALDNQEAGELAAAQLKTGTLAGFYDDVMIRVLGMVERDRYAGLLSRDQETLVLEAARDLNDEIAQRAEEARDAGAAAEPANARPSIRVLCIPVRHKADEIAAGMLAHLLADHGIDVQTASSVSLSGESVQRVGQEEHDMVVLSAIGPLAMRKADHLCRRVRRRYHDLPLIVGAWSGEVAALRERFPADASTEVVTTLADAVKAVRNAAARRSAGTNHKTSESNTGREVPTDPVSVETGLATTGAAVVAKPIPTGRGPVGRATVRIQP